MQVVDEFVRRSVPPNEPFDVSEPAISDSLVLLKNGASTLEALVHDLGPYLTDTDSSVRKRATALLALIVEVLAHDTSESGYLVKNEKVRVLCAFFGARLGDYASIGVCLRALRALLGFSAHVSSPNLHNVCIPVCKAVFNELNVKSLDQKLRHAVFELLLFLVTEPVHSTALASRIDGADTPFVLNLALFFVQSMAGERDPRNLAVGLRVAEHLLSPAPPARLGALTASLTKELFDVTSCYFPIMFRPPPNDPYGITRELLVGSLRDVFSANELLAPLVLPLLLEKLSSGIVDAKRDAIQTLERCLPIYARGNSLSSFLVDISAALEREVLHPHDRSSSVGGRAESPWTAATAVRGGAGISASAIGLNFSGDGSHHDTSGVGLYAPLHAGFSAASLSELPLVEAALHAVASLTKVLSQRPSSDWDCSVGRLVRTSVGELQRGADSLAGRGSARLLCAIASSSNQALSSILSAVVPVILDRLSEAVLHHRWGVRSALITLLAGLVHTVDPAIDYAPGAHPLVPFLPDVLARLSSGLCSLPRM